VNNAGISVVGNIEETSLDEWNLVNNINSTGVFLGTKYAIEAIMKFDWDCRSSKALDTKEIEST